MADDHLYCWARLDGGERGAERLIASMRNVVLPALERRGGAVFGVFAGLFGIGSGELVVVTSVPTIDGRPESPLDSIAGARVVEKHVLSPTVRPESPAPLKRPGLYVSRLFYLRTADVDEAVRLSREAWVTFEASTEYRSEPVGLWRSADRSAERSVLILLTWYDGLRSWELSRTPAPEARASFELRHALTTGTIAYATRLIGGA